MSIVQSLSSLLRVVLVAAFAVVVVAQKKERVEIRYVIPERFERATTTDENGLVQWAEHKKDKCQTCAGTGKTGCTTCERFRDEVKNCIECKRVKDAQVTCRSCAGLGHWPDPLEKVHCPECLGAGFAVCGLCRGAGQLPMNKDADRWGNCPLCRGDGGAKCGVCDGKRLVEPAALKPSLKDANSATLTKAIATADQMLKALETFTPTGKNTRKEGKELGKILGSGAAVFPPMKRAPKALDDWLGKVAGGSGYEGFEEREATALNMFKVNGTYYVKHQKRMMELALKRAEANEKLQAENKGK